MISPAELIESRISMVSPLVDHADRPRELLRRILSGALNMPLPKLLSNWSNRVVDGFAELRVDSMICSLNSGVPFQYICGYQWFWNSEFRVGPGVLIPRPETELLVEALLNRVTRPRSRVIELGAGSGNIGISCLQERPDWDWSAWEVSFEAFEFATENVRRLLPQNSKYTLRLGDFFLAEHNGLSYDVVVSNPPYVSTGALVNLPPQVRREPQIALDGGPDGLGLIERIGKFASIHLKEKGVLALEIGEEQSAQVFQFLTGIGFSEIECLKDLCGRDRIVVARRER